MVNWETLTHELDPEEIRRHSHEKPVMIFKHSTRCGISYSALDNLVGEWKPEKVGGLATYMLDVISHRDYAREIGNFFGIPHASPQLLLIDKGQVIYEQSHFGINFRELEDIIGKLNEGELR